ncbi:alpha/beta hydrolase fold domain-containing protein [Pararhodobacter zhoushanensis]|uniref:Alpha/beta hydrolase n=1 Tax=Pararhodobacter zhoushanensis TaxID=2479545 RepID=A0ABT3H2W4_9RHOB|nr:alpha/beta hydrolase [Pararhodobacter zhoushanensis]MCW1934020.1 alpha/beta hydrolase [Pararhodobacter zhoushanensis]
MKPLTDYSWLPADIRAFIDKTLAAYPADAVEASIAQQRDYYNAMCAEFDQPHPAGLTAEDVSIAGVSCRRYTPSVARPGVTGIYFHGGGFVVGGLESHDAIVAELAEQAQLVMIAVDYRLVPEHIHPAAYDDCLAVVDAVKGPKVLAGDSAGGTLAASVSAARPGDVAGQVLIYPGLGGDKTMPSFTRHAHAPMLTAAECEFYETVRYGGPVPVGDVTARPMDAEEYGDLPPTAIFTAEADPLASSGVEYAARLAEAGVAVSLVEEPGMVHGYLRARHMAKGARDSFTRIAKALRALAGQAVES